MALMGLSLEGPQRYCMQWNTLMLHLSSLFVL